MNKELLTVEFRYNGDPDSIGSDYYNTTVTIGIYDTLEEAVKAGEDLLDNTLSKYFQVRETDRFSTNGFFGLPERLVTNCCYPTKGVQYFAKITKLEFNDPTTTIENILSQADRYITRRKKEMEDD